MSHAKAEQAQVAAAKELLDRGYGRAVQQMEVNTKRFVVLVPEVAPDAETWLAQCTPKAGRAVQ